MIVFGLLFVVWWLAGPDRFTAGARTAAGTAAAAAGTGVRDQWTAGRDGRKVSRTARRDRWGGHVKGAKPHPWLLRGEHAAVVAGKTVKGTGQLAAAAARPVPGAVRDGWRKGREDHQARVEGKRVPLAVNPPWWHPKPTPEPGQAEDTPQDSGEDRPGTGPGSPTGQVPDWDTRTNIRADFRCQRCDVGRRRYTYDGLRVCAACAHDLDLEADKAPIDPPAGISPAGTPIKVWKTSAECGNCGADANYTADTTCRSCGTPFTSIQSAYPEFAAAIQRERPDLPTTTTREAALRYAIDSNPNRTAPMFHGGTMSPTPFGAELDNLTSVQDFAVKVADMAEESDFAQLVEFCKHASDETRDFGADMAGDVAEFEEIASKIGDLLSELVDAAQHVRDRSAELIGG